MTGIDLGSDPDFTRIHQHIFAWRVALAVAEYRPLVEAVDAANSQIKARRVRAIPTSQPIPVIASPTSDEANAQALTERMVAAFRLLAAGRDGLAGCIDEVSATELIPKTQVGRPENGMHRALCLLLVEKLERADRPKLTNHQVALVAHAYGVAAPAGKWDDWLERWGRLMNDARAEQPGTKTPRQRLIGKVRASRKALIPKR